MLSLVGSARAESGAAFDLLLSRWRERVGGGVRVAPRPFCSSFPRRRESSNFAFDVDVLEPELPRLNIAGHFLCWCKESNQRKHLFSPRGRCPQTARPCC